MGKWHLDGATLEEAYLGRGSFGRVYKIYCEERDSRGGRERYYNALKFLAIDAANSQDPNDPDLQKKLNRRLAKADHEIKIMKQLEGESNIAYFQSSQIIERKEMCIRDREGKGVLKKDAGTYSITFLEEMCIRDRCGAA